MFDHDFDSFTELLDNAFSLNPNWKPLPPKGKAFFFHAMAPYPLEVVSLAMTAHIRNAKRGAFQPTPADLVAQIEAASGMDGRPGVEEAWAIALTSLDENDTIVWTVEIAEALAACRPVLNMGDEIGARMAFKEAYTRIVDRARAERRPASWMPSLGHDKARHEPALRKAISSGLLPAPAVQNLLSPPAAVPADANAKAQIEKIRQMLATATAERQRNAELHAQREARATAAAKQRAAKLTENYQAGAAS